MWDPEEGAPAAAGLEGARPAAAVREGHRGVARAEGRPSAAVAADPAVHVVAARPSAERRAEGLAGAGLRKSFKIKHASAHLAAAVREGVVRAEAARAEVAHEVGVLRGV